MSYDTNKSSNSGASSHHSRSHRRHSSYSQPYSYGSPSTGKRIKKKNKEAQRYNSKRHHSMKNNNKIKLIIAIIICILIILAIAAYEIYDSLILPNYVKPVLEEVVTVMQDDKYTDKITQEIRRLYDLGQISGDEVEHYLEQHEKNSSTGNSSDVSTENNTAKTQSDSVSDDNSNSTHTTSTSPLGQNRVNVNDNDSSTSGSHYYLDSSSSEPTAIPDSEKINPATMSYDSLIAKAKSVMSADDFATAMSMKSKISLSKVKELRSDSSALLQYIQTSLTPDEYSTLLSLYAKYANILN